MALDLFPTSWRLGAVALLVALATPALAQQIGRGVNVTVYETPT